LGFDVLDAATALRFGEDFGLLGLGFAAGRFFFVDAFALVEGTFVRDVWTRFLRAPITAPETAPMIVPTTGVPTAVPITAPATAPPNVLPAAP
jgi:hypothetical protein